MKPPLGVEPKASRLQSVCSNQLSYRGKKSGLLESNQRPFDTLTKTGTPENTPSSKTTTVECSTN